CRAPEYLAGLEILFMHLQEPGESIDMIRIDRGEWTRRALAVSTAKLALRLGSQGAVERVEADESGCGRGAIFGGSTAPRINAPIAAYPPLSGGLHAGDCLSATALHCRGPVVAVRRCDTGMPEEHPQIKPRS